MNDQPLDFEQELVKATLRYIIRLTVNTMLNADMKTNEEGRKVGPRLKAAKKDLQWQSARTEHDSVMFGIALNSRKYSPRQSDRLNGREWNCGLLAWHTQKATAS